MRITATEKKTHETTRMWFKVCIFYLHFECISFESGRGTSSPRWRSFLPCDYVPNCNLLTVCGDLNITSSCFTCNSQSEWLTSGKGRAITQAVSRRLPTAVRRWGFCGGQSGTRSDFLLVLLFPIPILILPTAPHSFFIRGWYSRPNSGRRTKWTGEIETSFSIPQQNVCHAQENNEDFPLCSSVFSVQRCVVSAEITEQLFNEVRGVGVSCLRFSRLQKSRLCSAVLECSKLCHLKNKHAIVVREKGGTR
jgi:hypothetical protein